jgi:hypothetical protein
VSSTGSRASQRAFRNWTPAFAGEGQHGLGAETNDTVEKIYIPDTGKAALNRKTPDFPPLLETGTLSAM